MEATTILTRGDAQARHDTLLYDETDRGNPQRLNTWIASFFEFGQGVGEVPPALRALARPVPLSSLLDFSRPTFEKQFNLAAIQSANSVMASRWPLRALRDIALLNPSKRELRSFDATQSVSFVEMAAVSEEGFILRPETRVLAALLKGSYTYFAENDILLAKITPCMENGKCALATGLVNGIGLGSSEFHVIRADKQTVLPEFLFAYLNRQAIREAAASAMTGSSGHRRVPETFYSSLSIPLAPLDVQRAVVAGCEGIDGEVAAARHVIAESQASIEAAIREQYAANGPSASIDSVATQVQYGLSEKMNESGRGYKIFRMNEITQRRMVDGGQMKFADISPEEFAKLKLNKGDILFNRTNGSADHVGKVGLFDLEGDYCFASYLVRVVPNPNKVVPEFLVLMMGSEQFRQEALGLAVKSAGQININATKMRNIKVPVPPLAEQKRLVAKVRKLEQQIADAQALIVSTPDRRQAILQQYL